jgi:DNA-directed RNA polymerase subunit M/transcription elongation factor TFIIS
MVCPRCGGTLETYRLNDRESLACADCGYVDSAVSHERAASKTESWEDALERFHERRAASRGTGAVRTTDGDHRATE